MQARMRKVEAVERDESESRTPGEALGEEEEGEEVGEDGLRGRSGKVSAHGPLVSRESWTHAVSAGSSAAIVAVDEEEEAAVSAVERAGEERAGLEGEGEGELELDLRNTTSRCQRLPSRTKETSRA